MKNKLLFLIICVFLSFMFSFANTDNSKDQTKTYNKENDNAKAPELVYKQVPKYPEEAKLQGIEGKVYLWVYLNEYGQVEGVQIFKSSGSHILDDCAQKAAYECEFTPALIENKPVKSTVLLPYQFILLDYVKKI